MIPTRFIDALCHGPEREAGVVPLAMGGRNLAGYVLVDLVCVADGADIAALGRCIA